MHGGFKYLQKLQFGVSFHSVRERELLIKRSEGLVNRIPFIYMTKEENWFPRIRNNSAMFIYQFFAGERGFQKLNIDKMSELMGVHQSDGLTSGMGFSEGYVDDSRLNLRLIFDGIKMGGHAKNYSPVIGFLRMSNGRHCGVIVRDINGFKKNSTYEVRAKVIINATGIWMDDVCKELNIEKRIRRQRGSHLILSQDKLPLKVGIMFNHPKDNRIQFAIPWLGRIVFGTTDLDEPKKTYELTDESGISEQELDYLLQLINFIFPGVKIGASDIISTYCGIRPIIRNNSLQPYSSSRKHQIWDDNGIISIAGGKLTTFQYMSFKTLKRAERFLDRKVDNETKHSFLNQDSFFPEEMN